MKTTNEFFSSRATTRVDSPDAPQPHRLPGASNEMGILIGRLPVVRSFRSPRYGLLAKVDTGIDWFWFALTAVIYIGIPVTGLFLMLLDHR